MGEQVNDTIVIDAPIDTVWEIITDLEAYPQWADGVLETEVLDTTEEGYPYRAAFRVDAKVVEVSYTLRYRYENYDVRWELAEGETVSQLDGSYELWEEEDGSGTGVQYSLEIDIDLPLPGFLKNRAGRQIIEQGLHGLKKRAEEAS